jgi:outer membrane lipoprotein LolB
VKPALRRSRFALILGLTLALAACAGIEQRPAGVWLEERQALFAAHPVWSVSGRLSLSDGQRGGQLAFDWRASGEEHEVILRTVMGGRQWRLRFGPLDASLEGSDVDLLWGPDPDPLVEAAVGWPIPVRDLAWWIRGLAPPGADGRIRFSSDGSLSSAESPPWMLSFQRFDQTEDGLMPSRLQADSAPYRVRMVLRDWNLATHTAAKSL